MLRLRKRQKLWEHADEHYHWKSWEKSGSTARNLAGGLEVSGSNAVTPESKLLEGRRTTKLRASISKCEKAYQLQKTQAEIAEGEAIASIENFLLRRKD